jgi:uncharacterized protein involved in response to NO
MNPVRASTVAGVTRRRTSRSAAVPPRTATDRPPARAAVFLSYGFRPFFLLASIYAMLSLVAWMAAHLGGISLPGETDARFWHGHEMVFGFTMAAACGFLLTAVPNWTGKTPVVGGPLGLLVALWVAGRVAFWLADVLPYWVVAAADLALIPMLTVTVARPILAAGNRRNYIFLALLVTLFAANLLFHMDVLALPPGDIKTGLSLALYVFVVLVALIGGRVIPAFTSNALARRGDDAEVRSSPVLQNLSLAAMVIAIAADLALGDGPVTGVAALAVAAILALRMRHWQSAQILDDPILWVLHLGYAWVPVGFALKGLAGFSDAVSPGMALHAFAAGAAGTMIMAMMSRAALGHTGRSFTAPRPIVAAYLLVGIGALVRVLSPLATAGEAAMVVSSLLWSAGFLIYAVVYWPILTRPGIGD